MQFSIIIPVYNRPQEVSELLQSLKEQTYKRFEVLIVEDGSSDTCREICEQMVDQLNISYFFIENVGQGFARNFGIDQAKGDYFVFFDSDCIIPFNYLDLLSAAILERNLDAHGGPDAAETGFSDAQKAMDFAMTSFLTTGGIRGKLKDPSKFQARGFNMGFSKRVYQKIGGFVDPNQAEDIEISIRIKKAGFKLELVREAFVYHKRKNTFWSFIRQGYSFGRNRVNVSRFHPEAIKPVHLLPLGFGMFLLSLPVVLLIDVRVFQLQLLLLGLWSLAILVSSGLKFKSPKTAVLSLIFSFGQLLAYGTGLASELMRKWVRG
ncbi:glycosyltransferase [Arthrospiribacter ruber]|uniref:Glycosyltransferase n=1 Tax=Arthrospiribacter ruber TaxID=2487934 RepID=A0A951MGS2_9BACT|nr:glycosyltransferase [Arthrospiribacter ruber]MBW3470487.1 glycosyltransferase [Arthrospiribacter ruber]